MKTMKNLLLLLAAVFSFASCEKDEDKIYLSSIQSGELVATESAVVLSQANSNDIVLSLAWTKDALQISDPALSAIDVTIQTLQVSTTQDFSGVVSENVETSLSKAYTRCCLKCSGQEYRCQS
ncbi:SusE domain-containing protein [Bacteroides timonensis]|uniref:SusE domain-containing protein n=1 Tax=Bacteroides timonensis TaxID=1470345 RepID=UPI001FCC589A|nr:SusE domain-containing protein [Bacteroides timonensis]